MAVVPTYYYLGGRQATGGDESVKAITGIPNLHGLYQNYPRFDRAVPSGPDGRSGGGYLCAWDGTSGATRTATSATANTITDSTATWTVDEFVGRTITINGGVAAGDERVVLSNTATTITITTTWSATPSTSTFHVGSGRFGFYHFMAAQYAFGFPGSLGAGWNSKGDNWQQPGGGGITPFTMLLHSLADYHGVNAPGFRAMKFVGLGGFGSGFRPGQTSYVAWMAERARAQAVALAAGDTLDEKAIVIDASTEDIQGVNLNYATHVQEFIEGIGTDISPAFTASSGTTTTVTVSGAGWVTNQYQNRYFRATSGPAAGLKTQILSNTADTLTFRTAITTAPSSGAFRIDPLILLVSQHPSVMTGSLEAVSPFIRNINIAIQQANPNVRLFDMSWGEFAPASLAFSSFVPPDPVYYSTETYLQAGARIGAAIQAFYTSQPVVEPGSGIACYAMISDSQFAGLVNPLMVFHTRQESLLGPLPNTIREGVWIWDDIAEMVVPYNALANSNTFGTVSGNCGPDVTFLKRLKERHPDGVVLFKYARNSVTVTIEGQMAGAPAALESGTTERALIKSRYALFRQAVFRDLGRTPDMLGLALSSGENDTIWADANAAFLDRAQTYLDDWRDDLSTRTTGPRLAVAWQQGPPPSTEVDGGSVHGQPALRIAYRAKLASLNETDDRLTVLLNRGPQDYELQRDDSTHYGGEACFKLGYDAADALIALIDSEEGETETAEESSASGSAAFIAEDGSGLTDANSYCSVAFADTFHQQFGNPAAWANASDAEKKDSLRHATAYLSRRFGAQWRGQVANVTQGLDWPRLNAMDADTWITVSHLEMPRKLQRATALAALRHRNGTVLQPDTLPGEDSVTASAFSVGPISFSDSFAASRETQPRFPEVEQELRGLLRNGIGASMVRVTR